MLYKSPASDQAKLEEERHHSMEDVTHLLGGLLRQEQHGQAADQGVPE